MHLKLLNLVHFEQYLSEFHQKKKKEKRNLKTEKQNLITGQIIYTYL